MLVPGQVPGGRSGQVLDVLAVFRTPWQLLARYAPGDGGEGGEGGAGGGGEGGAGAGSGAGAGGAGGETGSDGQTFNAERAQRTIAQLREEVKQGKATKTELDEARAKLKELEDKDKSESERLSGDLKSTTDKLTAAEQRVRDMGIRVAVAESATASGIDSANVKAAIRLLDPAALKFDDDGNVTNAEAALKELVKEYPMLAGTGAGASGGNGRSGPPGTPGAAGSPSDAERVTTRAQEQRKSGNLLGF